MIIIKTMGPKIIGKIFIYPLTSNDYKSLRDNSQKVRIGSKQSFIIQEDVLLNATPVDVMIAWGYNPEGYGMPFDIINVDGTITFSCWNSCD